MKTSWILLIAAIFFSLNSSAIRHVGNGGGDAEMLLLKQYSALPLWLKSCRENNLVCPDFATLDRFELIAFVATEDLTQDCNQDTLIISNDSLYLDQSKAKTAAGVFNELLDVLNRCFFKQSLSSPISVDIQPQMLLQPVDGVAVLKGSSRDYFVSSLPSENLNQMVQLRSKCENLKFKSVWSKKPLGVLVKCESKNENYLIRITQNPDESHMIDVRYFSDEFSDN